MYKHYAKILWMGLIMYSASTIKALENNFGSVSSVTGTGAAARRQSAETFPDIFLKGMIIVKIKTVSYIRELSYPERNLTKRLVALCEKEMTKLFQFVKGKQTVKIESFRRGRLGTLVLVMDFDSTGNGNASEFKEVIDKKIKIPGRFINYDVDRKMAIFESYGVCCQPKVHYSFDSLSPGTIYDDSGFDNNGVINGRINITNRGKCGRAAKFISAYVSLRNFKGTKNVGTNSIAVMFWIKLLNQRSNSVILRGYYKGAVIELSLDRGFVKWRYITRDETTAFTLRHKRLLRPRRWTHIVGLYDPYSTIAKLYIDAKLASQSIVRKDLVDWRFTSWLTFGLKSSEGFLDDLYIYDCVLGKNIIENIKRNCGSEERCAPRGKNEYLIRIKLVSKNDSRSMKDKITKKVEIGIEEMFHETSGQQQVQTIGYRPVAVDAIMVDYSLQSIGNSDTRYLEAILQPPVTAGSIAGVPLASNDVSFLPVSGSGVCRSGEMKCNDGKCINNLWKCDGEINCEDGSDEIGCASTIDMDCDKGEYLCNKSRILEISDCISASYRCDGQLDCIDDSDEQGCAPPKLITAPISLIVVAEGESATCTCVATGVPAPKVSWHYKGRTVSSREGKILVNSLSGHGTLTIFNAEQVDSGDYICKMRNNRVRKVVAPSCTIQVRAFGKVCSPPNFNSMAQRSSECLRCFCHLRTSNCRSARLFRSKLVSQWGCTNCTDEKLTLVNVHGHTISTSKLQSLLGAEIPESDSYYWKLPNMYVGNKLTSYGGSLRFTRDSDFLQNWPSRIRRNAGVPKRKERERKQANSTLWNYVKETHYDGSWFNNPGRKGHVNDVPLINRLHSNQDIFGGDKSASGPRSLNLTGQYVAIIVGKDGTLLVSKKPLYVDESSVEIKIIEESWSERKKYKPVSRKTLLRVLTDVKYILVNARASDGFISRLFSFSLDTAVPEETGEEEVVTVERCACPIGYQGLSCEECTVGYFRSKWSNRCIKCTCFNHSDTCNPRTGKCENCTHNTVGRNCQYCKAGFYGDATIGTSNDCKACACPLAVETNQFSKSCYLDSDGNQTCSQCQNGYTGRNCERCAQGYQGNPMVLGGSCYKIESFSQCDIRGSVSQNVTSSGEVKCICKANVVGSNCSQCRPGTFNLQAFSPSGCEKCFCTRVSKVCSSLIGSKKTINATFTNGRFLLTTIRATVVTPHVIESENGEEYLRKVFPVGHKIKRTLYWDLPIEFVGSKVESYGGYMEYTVTYSWNETKKPRNAYDVLLLGKRYALIYYGRSKPYVNNGIQTFRVPLDEKFWRLPGRHLVSRTLFLLRLARLDRIMILATPMVQMKETRLHDVKMVIAVENTKDVGKPVYRVERCSCPEGYIGYSCETCASGFTRAGPGLLARCIKCKCNGHSSSCDPKTGECKDCQHNTGGKHCEKCNPGFYGNATTRSEAACRPCPCPYVNPPNRFSPTCYLGDDGLPVCDRCRDGYEGRRCERCKDSYTGNPEVLGEFCKPVTSCGCDPRGSRSTKCDLKTKKCLCKKNVQGETCNECKSGFYNLQGDNEDGCTKCFCMGFNTTCRLGDYFRDEIDFSVYSSTLPTGFSISTEDLSHNISSFVVDVVTKRIRFLNSAWLQQPNIYWLLPPKFLGNKVMLYGGALKFSYSYIASGNTVPTYGSVVKIKGSGMTLHYRDIKRIPSDVVRDIKIVFLEKHWEKPDGSVVSRFDLMRVLVYVDAIMIRASYSKGSVESSIADIRMNIYPDQKVVITKAIEVERCDCPRTYYGSSCERCSASYTRLERTFGQCVPCQCNSHSYECDERTGICKNCRDDTTGNNCELCPRGFYGDATKGTPEDCKQCPCPLPGSSNRFSETCFMDKDGQPTCDSCQEGYSGRRCEKCSLNYTGNPLTPGGKCFKVRVELNPKVKITPERITLQEGDSARFVCNVKTIRPAQVLWSREDGQSFSSRGKVNGNILSFKSLKKSDAGVYVCAASNDIALRLAKTELVVKEQQISAVIVSVSPKSRYIPVGGTARFSCTSKAASRYSIKWTRENDLPMSPTTYVQDGTLFVNDAKLGDGGTYICTGKNALNIDRAIVSLHVGVVVKPQVSVSPQKQIVDIAQRVTFRCSASAGFPAATLRWERGDGRQLPRFSKFVERVGLFKILAASRRDEGEYMCIASNQGGDSIMKVKLLVKGPNSLPKASVTPTILTVDEGNRAVLRCEVSGDEKLDVKWSRRRGLLPESASIRRNILEIEETTSYDSDFYTCTVTNRYGRAEANARLFVNKDISKPPKVVIKPDATVISVMEGHSLNLECHVTGISKPFLRWKRLSKEGYIANGTNLNLKNLKLGDTGIYVCVAETEEGEKMASVSVVVKRNNILPRVQVEPNNISVRQGAEVTLICKTSSQLPVTISWSRADKSPLDENHSTRRNVLVIRNIKKDDQGTYICLARNSFGASKATAELTVIKS